MVLAWVGTAGTGIFLAAFMRQAWVDKPYWFLVSTLAASVPASVWHMAKVHGYGIERTLSSTSSNGLSLQ